MNELDLKLLENSTKLYREGLITSTELRHFILKALHLELAGDTILIGSHCALGEEK